MITTIQTAFEAGRAHGLSWLGPAGDGGMAALSWGFVREQAEQFACGFRFAELRDGPDEAERELADAYLRGFSAGLQAQRAA